MTGINKEYSINGSEGSYALNRKPCAKERSYFIYRIMYR
jgi:hypothetical protein